MMLTVRILFILFLSISLSSCLEFDTLLNTIMRNYDKTTQTIIVESDDGFLYRSFAVRGVTANSSSKIEKIDINTGVNTTILGSGNLATTDGIGLAAEFKKITAMAFVPGSPQKLIIGDNCSLREVNLSTLQVTTKAGLSDTCNDLNGVGTAARFANVRGIIVSGTTLFVATANQIKQVDLATYTVSSYIGSDTAGDTDAIGPAAAITPYGMTKLGDFIYLLDGAQKIKKISTVDLSVTTIAGQSVSGTEYNSQDGVGTSATLLIKSINAATTDNSKYLYFTENQKIRKLNLITNEVSTIIDSYNWDEDINSNQLSQAKVYRPCGIVFTNKGLFISNLYGVRRLK